MENNIAKVKSIEEAATARMLRTCRTCAISRLQGAGGVDGVSLRQVACVCEVQGPVFHFRIGSDEHGELLCWFCPVVRIVVACGALLVPFCLVFLVSISFYNCEFMTRSAMFRRRLSCEQAL